MPRFSTTRSSLQGGGSGGQAALQKRSFMIFQRAAKPDQVSVPTRHSQEGLKGHYGGGDGKAGTAVCSHCPMADTAVASCAGVQTPRGTLR